MWRHFFEQNEKILCCGEEDIPARVKELTRQDLMYLRNLDSLKDLGKIGNDEVLRVCPRIFIYMEFTFARHSLIS